MLNPPILSTLFVVVTLSSIANAQVDVRDYGAKGDGITDDTRAIQDALSASPNVHFPAGVYRVSNGIRLPPSARITGAGSPTLGTFPITDDDKRFFTAPGAPGLPGTTLLFTGKGQARCSTGRDDEFATSRYAVRTAPGLPFSLSDLAIVLNFRFRDPGQPLTTPETDRRADYDIGLLVDDSPGGSVRNVDVFGYWKHAGLAVVSRSRGSNPDYNTFWNCQFSGNVGVALLGQQSEGPGLSGTQFYGCNFFASDHHSRANGHTGRASLYIDGNTDATRAEINGHYFFGGCVRTYSNVAVELDHATNLCFNGVVFEVPARRGGDDHSNQIGRVIGSANTGDITLVGCRMHNVGLAELGSSMRRGQLTIVGNTADGISLRSDGTILRLTPSNKGSDPLIQIACNPSNANSGWTVRLDRSADDRLVIRHDNRPMLSLTTDGRWQTAHLTADHLQLRRARTVKIEKGTIPQPRSRLKVTSGGEKELKRIEGGDEGSLIILESAIGSRFTVGDNSDGNIRVTDRFVFDSAHDRLTLICSGDEWVEIARSDFPAAETEN